MHFLNRVNDSRLPSSALIHMIEQTLAEVLCWILRSLSFICVLIYRKCLTLTVRRTLFGLCYVSCFRDNSLNPYSRWDR